MIAISVLVLLLILGCFALYGAITGFKLTALIVSGGFALVFALHLALFFYLPATYSFSTWETVGQTFGYVGQVDAAAWIGSLAFLVVLLISGFSSLAKLENVSKLPAVCLSFSGLAGLLVLWAGNLLALVLALAFLDVVIFSSLFVLRQRTETFSATDDSVGRRFSLALGFDLLSTLCVTAAALFAFAANGSLAFEALPYQTGLALLFAAIFRVGASSFTASQASSVTAIPAEVNVFVNLTAFLVAGRLLYLAAPTLQQHDLPPRLLTLILLLGLYGAIRVWLFSAPRIGLMQIVFAQACLLAITAVFGGESSGFAVLMQTFSVTLGLAILFTYQKPRHNAQIFVALAFLGTAALVGLPLTAGFVGQFAFFGGLSNAREWLLLALALLIQILLMTGYLRILFGNNPDDLPESNYSPGYLVILLGIPCLLVLTFGILPIALTSIGGLPIGFTFAQVATAPGLLAVGATLFSLMLGVVLWYFDSALRPLLIAIREALFTTGGDVVSSGMLRGTSRVSNGIGLVLEGEGAVLWALVLIVLFASAVVG